MAIQRKKILIVDDDHLIRFVLMALMNSYEFKTVVAVNGREAVEKWEQENFRAILMDINMPTLDGLSATREIRRREKEESRSYTPIIGVSGIHYSKDFTQLAEAGMDGCIAKPFTKDELMNSLSPFI